MEIDQPKINIADFLAKLRDEVAPLSLQSAFLDFEEYYERRLWHQLTGTLIQFYENPESGPLRIPLFKNFVLTFAGKINQLKLVTLGLSAASQCKDNQEALEFLTALAAKVNNPVSQDAYVYATVEVARIKLLLQDFAGARKALDEAEKILESFDSVESVVHASFYRVNADYYNAKLEFASYYKNALLYLACIQISDLSIQEQQERAYNLALAALLGETIYNFGELLLHPILDSLKDTEHAWLRDLLFAFNAGDLAKFNGLSGHLSKQPLLAQQSTFLREKICLSALTEAVFRRPPHDRALSFSTILEETKVQPQEVEHLLMKALSLGLVRGSIDQVAEVARISWVQPKVLDKSQIEGMRHRLMEWDESVHKLGKWMETRLALPTEA
ncbi:26S proteasome regulatory subunit [Rhizina undulata]